MHLSHSSIQTYLDCRQKFKLDKIDKLTTKKRKDYFLFGEAIHKFLELHYKGVPQPLEGIKAIYDKARKSGTLTADDEHKLSVDEATVTGIAKAYPRFYKGDSDRFTKYVPEHQFTVDFPTFQFVGFIDMLVLDAAGDWWVFETKTASPQVLNNDYIDRVKIDSQVSGYMFAAKKLLGVMPRGVLYNVIKKPSIRLKRGESRVAFCTRVEQEYTKFGQMKEYFVRHELLVDHSQVKRWLKMTDKIGREIIEYFKSEENVAFPMRNTGQCIGKYGACPYLEICITNKVSPLLYEKREDRSVFGVGKNQASSSGTPA